ncbi:type I restriction enzyme M protein [Spinactinospora alkalitolerans]|uniref:site-specific DNA-methyltransferase (adenine-specific) n=1 Tax=Spinactinospora alkalitolerans TaxID=687207 RepID=A0A852TZY7_9ACTN|nr:class I SAM-dependent DNA methyltransferase [Spinactinospora alkalitolerans]NYE48857.1 type I restriction enzyme M protein [Spinactinospora alkalitolerans]
MVAGSRGAKKASRTGSADLKDTLWKAADKLRGSMDAAEYKHFVLGLIFLKYVSDAFAERRTVMEAELREEGGYSETDILELLEDRDEYTGYGVFWVPQAARWESIAERAKTSSGEDSVGKLLDDAMKAVGNANPDLKGALPQGLFNARGVDERRLGELVDLINRIGFGEQLDEQGRRRSARDVLGEVYEYCLAKFALAEGRRGGEYYTPASVVKLLVAMLEPQRNERVYDPACGSGGMFVQAEKFIESHGGSSKDIAVYGQELNQNTWRLAKMNLAIHGIGANLGNKWGDTFHDDEHPDMRFNVVMANPPFNISDWGGDRLVMDPRWQYGAPPVGNANYAWLQHMAYKTAPKTGRAGVVLANGSMSSKQSGEGDIRRAMVEDDLVACMVALPGQLFRSTQIPACLWFLARDKSAGSGRGSVDRRGQVLFIDARHLGQMISRTEKELTDEEIGRIAGTFHAWLGTESAKEAELKYEDVGGFCKSAELAEIREHDFILTPGRYVGAAEVEEDPDAEPVEEKIARLTKELFGHFEKSTRLEAVVREQLGRIG